VSSIRGELIWYRRSGGLHLAVLIKNIDKETTKLPLRLSFLAANWYAAQSGDTILYRHPLELEVGESAVEAGPVYAILAGGQGDSFQGGRLNFRDLMNVGREKNSFVYVLPAANVNNQSTWTGFVRLGHHHWIALPCPRPIAVYNRVPTRFLERSAAVVSAKSRLRNDGIPVFNREYFSKSVIYRVIQRANLQLYLPETSESITLENLLDMLTRHDGVFFKPTGGSIGHGMILVTDLKSKGSSRYEVAVLKNTKCTNFVATSTEQLWSLILREKVVGQYVLQAAKRLIQWNHRPCDFRLLLQKSGTAWGVVGKGVRVAGKGTITTHVPNGGHIMDAKRVLEVNFGSEWNAVELTVDQMALNCAEAIDGFYKGELGEMSMDIGIDASGKPWFFEANAKPMKFDEKDIRRKSLEGVLQHLYDISDGKR